MFEQCPGGCPRSDRMSDLQTALANIPAAAIPQLKWSDCVSQAAAQLRAFVLPNDLIHRQIARLIEILRQIEHNAPPPAMGPAIRTLDDAQHYFHIVRHSTNEARLLGHIPSNPARQILDSVYRLRTGNTIRPRAYQQVQADDVPVADRGWIQEKNQADEEADLRESRRKHR